MPDMMSDLRNSLSVNAVAMQKEKDCQTDCAEKKIPTPRTNHDPLDATWLICSCKAF
jgi:hypothetical protein